MEDELKNKILKIYTKSGFFHKGQCIESNSNLIKLQDRKEGLMIISMDSIEKLIIEV